MGRPKGIEVSDEVKALGHRIQLWRAHRIGHAHMPRDIWTQAIRFSGEFGACRVAKAVGLDYKGLRRKIALVKAREHLAPQSFVELPPQVLAHQASARQVAGRAMEWTGSTVELSMPDGTQLWVRLGTDSLLDVAGLVSAFLGKDQRSAHFPIGGVH